MAITAEQVKSIRQELDKLRPASATLARNTELSVKQTIIALAPTLERMKKRGFEITEIIEKLRDKGIEIKPQTLAKYLAEARRQKESRKARRQDTPSPPVAKAAEIAKREATDRPPHLSRGGFIIRPDTPLDEL